MSDIKTFNTVSALKYWCYKILPLVYDDSLSYYEVLCRVTKKLNEVIANTNNIPEIIADAVANGGFLDNLQEQIADLNDKDSKTATADRYTGELIWLNGDLYRITRPMLAGDQYIESSEGVTGNIEKVTLEEWINRYLLYVKAAITLNDQKYNVIASKPFKSGTLLWWKGNLYRAKQAILLNEYLSTDVNLEAINLEQIIKDIDTRLSDASNLIAQEITDRSKLIKTDENNNTVIETSNKLIESSRGREITANGTDTEIYTGAVTRNYEQPVNETYSGVYNITSGDKKFNVIDTHNFVYATDYGVSETNDDNSDKLNELLANNDCVVLPAGHYKFSKPIEIFKHNITVMFIGTIQSTADWAIKIRGGGQNVSARFVIGSNNGIQILGANKANDASGASVFTFDIIDAAKIGLELNCSHENSGIQACNFYLNRISFGTIGIHFICTSNGNWINQNVFENFWCFAKKENVGTGIKMEKGPGQYDKFNQNHFNSFSCEGCNTYFDLEFAATNYFNDFRAIEDSGSRKLFKLASDTTDNIFRTSERLHFSDLDDNGIRNIYEAIFEDEHNIEKTDRIIIFSGFYNLCNGLTSKSAYIEKSVELGLSDYYTKFTISPNADTTITLPPTYGNRLTSFPFWVETADLQSHKVILQFFNGRKLFDSFEGYKKYLFTPSGIGEVIYNVTIF